MCPYSPPLDCGEPGSWAAITLNFTVTSNGTQYDRLAIFTFQNVESSCLFPLDTPCHCILMVANCPQSGGLPLLNQLEAMELFGLTSRT